MLVGTLVVLMGMATHPWLMSLAGFGGLFFIPLVNGSNQAIWQLQVPPQMKGRVFSLTRYSALFRPIGYLVAGALADDVLEPFMRHAPSDSPVSWIVGTGPGRGSALLLVAMGLVTIVAAALALRSHPLREMDHTPVNWTSGHSGAHCR
jgi:MFS transporter, DHA3 family, macrolide efflux protein